MMSQESQEKPGGNTKNARQSTQLYVWMITIPYENCSASQLSQELRVFCKKFTFQAEIGEETEYKHWQIAISLKTKEYFNTVKNLFPAAAHIEPAKDSFACFKYCCKTETRIEGPFTEKSIIITTISSLRPWQAKLKEELLVPCTDDRKLIWYFDEGNTGKTAFCKYMVINHGATFVSNGKNSDIAYAIGDDPKIVLLNYTRTLEDHINYGILESIKDGLMFSPKYESKTKIFNSPHVVVFANFRPLELNMTIDRWDIRKTLKYS